MQRVQVATTETVRQTEAQQRSSWSPWKVLSPFGNKQKRQQAEQQQLQTVSEAELWNMLEAEQEGEFSRLFIKSHSRSWPTQVVLPSAACS
jgi:hypothetical protein